MSLYDELVEVTRKAYPVPAVSYVDRAIRAIESYDGETISPMQLYHITAPLNVVDAVFVSVVGLDWWRQRRADETRWADDGGSNLKD